MRALQLAQVGVQWLRRVEQLVLLQSRQQTLLAEQIVGAGAQLVQIEELAYEILAEFELVHEAEERLELLVADALTGHHCGVVGARTGERTGRRLAAGLQQR